MATHKSAIKRNRQNIKRRARNKAVESRLKTLRKKVLTSTGRESALANLKTAISAFHKAAGKGVLHKNTAARRISQIQRFVNHLS